MPAATLLLTKGVGFFFSGATALGVSGALKGCAAEVDVAAGGLVGEDAGRGGADCAAEMGAALKRDEVLKKRLFGMRAFEAARRQLRQIIFVWLRRRQLNSSSSSSFLAVYQKFGARVAGAAELFLRADGANGDRGRGSAAAASGGQTCSKRMRSDA